MTESQIYSMLTSQGISTPKFASFGLDDTPSVDFFPVVIKVESEKVVHKSDFGAVKLKYIALVTVLMSFFGIASSNAGGEISHLGGALLGAVFVLSLRKGVDITAGINKVFDAISDVFKPRKMRVSKGNTAGKYKMSDAEYNQYKADKMKEIDRILDKIKSSGYDSLSTDEKKQLFEQGKK